MFPYSVSVLVSTQLVLEVLVHDADRSTGHQGIGTTFGAKITHAPHIKHGQASKIGHTGIGVLKDLPQNFASIRYNSLVLDFEGMPLIPSSPSWVDIV